MPQVMDRALMAHAQIKKRLCEAIRTPGLLTPEEIRSDRTCAFGLWIYGRDSIAHRGSPQFQSLKDIHAEFHQAAYRAALAVVQGRRDAAETSIRGGDFEMVSRALVRALIEMKAVRLVLQEAEQSD